jgi:hypothetical protein
MLLVLERRSCKFLAERLCPIVTIGLRSIIAVILVQQSLTLLAAYTKWHHDVVYRQRNGETIEYRLFFYHDAYRVFDKALDWLRPQAQPTEILAVSMPQWVYLRTGLKAVMSPFELNPATAQRLLDSVPVEYLILDEGLAIETKKYMSRVVEHFPDLWARVYSTPVLTESGSKSSRRFEIYRRVGRP